ncbi:hypothetical protein K502DRAFT_319687 [Neoconidiobolus thromboides FSU 785]|nr:hypothetical protein K502DRAFT_319687 [Neoconidiobolus thromboides FSU 785]
MIQITPIGFYKAPLTKFIIFTIAICSVLFSLLRVQHYLHLQLKPHLSKYHQFWRILTSQLAYKNSGELFISALLFYRFRIIERLFGTKKYLSFMTYSFLFSSLFQVLLLLLLEPFNFTSLPSGPYSLLFSIIFLFHQLIPVSYQIKVFKFQFNDKLLTYLLIFQLLILRFPYSILPSLSGVLIGALYYYDTLGIKGWRYPIRMTKFFSPYFNYILASSPSPRNLTPLRHLSSQQEQRVTSSALSGESDILPPGLSVRDTFNTFNTSNTTNNTTDIENIEVNNQNLELLQAMFPQLSRETIIRSLANHNGDINGAGAELLRL